MNIKKYKQIILFLFVGALSALVDVGFLYILAKKIEITNNLAISISFLLGLIVNYLCHTYFTFQKKLTIENAFKYLILVGVNYLNTLFLIYLLNNLLGIDIVIAKIITLPIIAIVTFILSKIWVYKD